MIIGCMITLNNEMYVENALKSLSYVSDRIVVVDGGSYDTTLDICRNYTNEIIINKWTGDHSTQRNIYINYIKRNYPNSWCFYLDSDETIDYSKSKVISEICSSEAKRSYKFRRKWLVSFPASYISSPPHFPDWQLRLFKVNRRTEFIGLIHESLGSSLMHKLTSFPYVKFLSGNVMDFDIWHLDLVLNSYDIRKEKVQKYARMEPGSGLLQYYLPEDIQTGISIIGESKARLVLFPNTLKMIDANKQHWARFLATKANVF